MSVVRQTFDLKQVEIIVLDDGSGDGTPEVVKNFLGTLNCRSRTFVELGHTGKPGLVRNKGLQMAGGKYLLCLDGDDWISPDFLEISFSALERNRECDLAYTDRVRILEGRSFRETSPEWSLELLTTQNICNASVFMRKEVWEQSRGYAANTMYEDWDFWLQAAANGFQGMRIPVPGYFYRVHSANYSRQAVQKDGLSKAAIVLNNKRVFEPEVVRWAEGVLRKEIWAAGFQRGLIPRKCDVIDLWRLAREVMDSFKRRTKRPGAGTGAR